VQFPKVLRQNTKLFSRCLSNLAIYGASGSTKRRKYQEKRNHLLALKPESLEHLFKVLNIKPTRHTAAYIQKRKAKMTKNDKEEKEESKDSKTKSETKKASSASSTTKKKKKRDDESSASSGESEKDDSSASSSTSSLSVSVSASSRKSRKSSKHLTPIKRPKKKSKTPPRGRHVAFGSPARAMEIDEVTVDPYLQAYEALEDKNAPDGSVDRPFVIKANLRNAYSNREFNIQYVPQITIPGTPVRHRPAVHIRLYVPVKDINLVRTLATFSTFTITCLTIFFCSGKPGWMPLVRM
jgi:hypothetical protein